MAVPAFGLGTYRLTGQTVIDSVRNALSLGYRAIDTAQVYGNEADIGEAIADSGVPREALYLTTKIWVDNLSPDKLIPSLEESRARLRTDYVDLTLIHWPSPGSAVPLSETLNALVEAKTQGITSEIGVSNFTIALLRQAIEAIGANQIATNQVELSPYMQNRRLADFMQDKGIHLTSYMTLGYGKVLGDAAILKIAEARQAMPAQIVLAWALQQGYSVIPSSTSRAHMASNLKAMDIRLSDDEMAEMAKLDRGERLASPAGLAPVWD